MRAKRNLLDMAREHARKSALALLESMKGSGISEKEVDRLAAEARRWARRKPKG